MDGFKRLAFCVLVVLCLFIPSSPARVKDTNLHTSVILFGANGDLSGKYLWQSIFDLYSDRVFALAKPDGSADAFRDNSSFNFIGVGLSPPEKGKPALDTKMAENIHCGDSSHSSLSVAECLESKKKFMNIVEYFQFSDGVEGYTRFCKQVADSLAGVDSNKKKRAVMYMAISTTAYVYFLENFHKICHKRILPSDVDIQWALEKPFGVDRMSARAYADKIQSMYKEEEIYHVDHYLQKSVVKTILPFRYLNKDLEKMWNKDHVERVEIFLKETLDIKGRASFYNSMGVLLDIHQSHLTELIALIAMETPRDVTNEREIMERKSDLIRLVESVKGHNSLFGQYADYAQQVSQEMSNDTKTSHVPTFAAVVLKITGARWKGVPFVLVSGKQLGRRESFVRVIFKDRKVCVSGCDENSNKIGQTSRPQVVFHIGHGDLSRPAILVSKSLVKEIVWPQNIVDYSGHTAQFEGLYKNNDVIYQMSAREFFTGIVDTNLPAYHSIIADLVDGTGSHFVNTQRLLLSWHIWDSIVTSGNKHMRLYRGGDEEGVLNFSFDNEHRVTFDKYLWSEEEVDKDDDDDGKMKYVSLDSSGIAGNVREGGGGNDEETHTHTHTQTQSPTQFLGWKLITSTSSLLPSILADAITEVAREEIKTKGSFHMALSGGSSVIPMLRSLAASLTSSSSSSQRLSWDRVHLWQVDERCVPHHHPLSNFGTLERELIRDVDIPFSNVHAMPVDIAGDLCDDSLGGAHVYTEAVRTHVLHARMDLVVLGLGSDGHTASLFPGSAALNTDSDTFVTITNDGPEGSSQRMTLTLPLINLSKRVAVLVTGSHKREILQQLETSRSVDRHPILGVRPSNGTLTWYIDDLALTPSSQ